MQDRSARRRLRRALKRRHEKQRPEDAQYNGYQQSNVPNAITASVLPGESRACNSETYQGDRKESSSDRSIAKSTRNIARLTFVLAAIAIVSAIITFGQWFELHSGSKDTAKVIAANVKLADAAKQTADISLAKEMPNILVTQIEVNTRVIGATESRSDLLPRPSSILMTYINYGGTRAILTEICLDWDILLDLPSTPTYRNIEAQPTGTIIQPNQGGSFVAGDYKIEFTDQQRANLYVGKIKFWAWGYIA